jgi:hypothetical protein
MSRQAKSRRPSATNDNNASIQTPSLDPRRALLHDAASTAAGGSTQSPLGSHTNPARQWSPLEQLDQQAPASLQR